MALAYNRYKAFNVETPHAVRIFWMALMGAFFIAGGLALVRWMEIVA